MLAEIGLAQGACTLWQEELLLDYTIEVEDQQFNVHKVIMASVSHYFKAMMTGGMMESRANQVRLEGLSSLAIKNIIEYIYTGEFGSAKASAEERLACAMYLQIPAAIKICASLLCEEVNNANCFHVLSTFKTYVIKDGIDRTDKFIKQNVDDIIEDCDSEDLPYEQFLSLMEYWRKSECQLFVRAVQWLKKDYEKRKVHLNDILSRIRYCLMSPNELALIESMKGIISDSDHPWHKLVGKAFRYHEHPTHQKVLERSEQIKVRSELSPVCFGTDLSVAGKLFSIQKENMWKSYDVMNPLQFINDKWEFLRTRCLAINNFIFVCIESGEKEVQCLIFDPRTLTWSTIAQMGIPREKCALVYHEDYLYAFGGCERGSKELTDVIEKYDFHTNNWSLLASKMPVNDLCAFSIGGYIWLCTKTNAVYTFDPPVGKWTEKAAFREKYEGGVVVVEIDREKVIARLDDDLRLHYYKPSVNQWLVFDRHVPTKIKLGHSEYGHLMATANTLYLLDYDVAGEVDEDGDPVHCTEQWTFGEKGLTVETIVDRPHPRVDFMGMTGFLALLSIP